MPSPLYFIQECPTCGRSLQIRVGYLGKQVVCHIATANFKLTTRQRGRRLRHRPRNQERL